jgi:hypothetical protein
VVALILLVLAFLCFIFAAVGQTILDQPPLDLAFWGLACWALAILLGQPIIATRLTRE